MKKEDNAFTNKVGTINFATMFFDLQKTVPQDRYIEPRTTENKEPELPIIEYINKAIMPSIRGE